MPPLCRETQSLGQQMLNAPVGINGLMDAAVAAVFIRQSGSVCHPNPVAGFVLAEADIHIYIIVYMCVCIYIIARVRSYGCSLYAIYNN